jgi:1-acyl-sn-glycerol-3-phosphate acyltransferase
VLPTVSQRPFGYRLARATLGRLVRLLYRVDVEGLDHVPDRGPAILAANHLSFMDSIFLALTSPRPIAFLAKAEYFDHRLTRWLLSSTGQIPLRRGSPAGARRALDAASEILDQDGTIGTYPEGTRSRDGCLHRGHRGPALLAMQCDAPIVPVGLIGTDAVQRPGQRLPRPFKSVRVHYGEPIRVTLDATGNKRAVQSRSATDTIMRDIAALSGQRYVDRYARVPVAG